MGTKSTVNRKGTKTSSFGAPGRINHDSSQFYSSRLYEGVVKNKKVKYLENPIPQQNLNKLFCKSSENMEEMPDNSIHLMVTSPPYYVIKVYDQSLNLNEYLQLLNKVWRETYRVLVPGGRACIIVANPGGKFYIPLHRFIIEGMQNIGFLMRGEIIWDKSSIATPSPENSSGFTAENPVLRDLHEYILVYSKDIFSRKRDSKINTISKKEFLESTKSVWTFTKVAPEKICYPESFPEGLAHRLIQLYTFESDVILDPFAGCGTTCISAIKSNRNFVGYDINPDYIKMAEDRISAFVNQAKLFD